MSHPVPSNEHGNEYPEDAVTHYPKKGSKSKALHKAKKTVLSGYAHVKGVSPGHRTVHENARGRRRERREPNNF